MEDQEIISLVRSESDRVERKRQLKNVEDAIGNTICAFANDIGGLGLPGLVVIGIEDDGSCAGTNIDDDLLKRLADYRQNITPFPVLAVRTVNIDGCLAAVVIVEPSSDVPLRYRRTVYVRVGPTTRAASSEDERRLNEKRRHGMKPFDLRPVQGSTIQDLNLDFFETSYLPSSVAPEVIAANQRSTDQKLASLRIIDALSGDPTVTGLLLIGRDPLEYMSGAYIQFLRIAGTTLTDTLLDEKRISGRLDEIVLRIDEVLLINMSSKIVVSGSTESRFADYPIDAIRQMVRNAIMHRNYEGTNAPIRIYWFEDRIEIFSPGGPYGQVTPENFGTPGITDYRNPHIAEAMRNLGFAQRFGMGFQIAEDQLLKNGNPPLEKQVEQTNILVILRKSI